MKHVLCLFDYGTGVNTGYSTVSKNLVDRVKRHFGENLRLSICATNYLGPEYIEYDGTVKVFSGKLSQNMKDVSAEFKGGDDYGRLHFMDLLLNNHFDGIFYIGNLGVIAPAVPMLQAIRQIKIDKRVKPFTSVIYFPIEGPLQSRVKNMLYDASQINVVPKQHRKFFNKDYTSPADCLDFFDIVVTYTNYGKSELLKLRPSMEDRINVVYHGTNTQEFYPLDKYVIQKFRDRYFGWNSTKFIIGCINKNQSRKDIPATIFAFIEAKNNWDKTLPPPFLYLHTNPDQPNGLKLRQILASTGLEENKDYMFPKGSDASGYVDIVTLNKIYNSIDLSVSTARGGGWELPVTECMACKTACIIPDHTSLGEIGADGRAMLLTEFLPVVDSEDSLIRKMCHPDEVAEKIIEVAKGLKNPSPGKITEMIDNAFEWATRYTWKYVSEDWIGIFEAAYFMQ